MPWDRAYTLLMGWSGFADRIGMMAGGLWDSVEESAGLVWDVVSIAGEMVSPWDTSTLVDDQTSALEALAEQAVLRFQGVLGGVFGPEGLVGAPVGGLPEGVRSPLRGAVRETTEHIDQWGRDLIREPLAQLGLQAGFASAPGGGGFSNLWSAENRERAVRLTQENAANPISVGQAYTLMATTRDINDPEELARVMGSDWYDLTSGSLDALAQIFLDPLALAGKAVKVMGLTPGARSLVVNTLDDALAAGGAQARLAGVVARNHRFANARGTGFLDMVGRYADGVERTQVGRIQARALMGRRSYMRSLVSRGVDPEALRGQRLADLASLEPAALREAVRRGNTTAAGHLDMVAAMRAESFAEVAANLAERTRASLDDIAERERLHAEAMTASERSYLDDITGMDAETAALRATLGQVEPGRMRATLEGLVPQMRDASKARARREASRRFERLREAKARDSLEAERMLAIATGTIDPADIRSFADELMVDNNVLTERHQARSLVAQKLQADLDAHAQIRPFIDTMDRSAAATRREGLRVVAPLEAEARRVERRNLREGAEGQAISTRIVPEQVAVAEVLPLLSKEMLEAREVLQRELDHLMEAETLVPAAVDAETLANFAEFGGDFRTVSEATDLRRQIKRLLDQRRDIRANRFAEPGGRTAAREAERVARERAAIMEQVAPLEARLAELDAQPGTRSSAVGEVLPPMRAARRKPLSESERGTLNASIADLEAATPASGISEFAIDLGDSLAMHRARIEELVDYLQGAEEFGLELTTDMLQAVRNEVERARGARTEVALSQVRQQMGADTRAGLDALRTHFADVRSQYNSHYATTRLRLAEVKRELAEIEGRVGRNRAAMVAVQDAADVFNEDVLLRTAHRVATRLFGNQPHAFQAGLLLASAGPRNAERALAFLLGDPTAIATMREQLTGLMDRANLLFSAVDSDGLLDDYRKLLRSPRPMHSATEEIDRLAGLISASERMRRDFGGVRVLQPEHVESITRWDLANNAENVFLIDAELRMAERRVNFLHPLIMHTEGSYASAAGALRMLPKADSWQAVREIAAESADGVGRVGQIAAVYTYGTTKMQRAVVNTAAAAHRWAYPANPTLVSRIRALPVRGALSSVDYLYARRAGGPVAYDDISAHQVLESMGHAAGDEAGNIGEISVRFQQARGLERHQIFQRYREDLLRKVLERHGLEQHAEEFAAQILESSRRAHEANVFGVHIEDDALVHTASDPRDSYALAQPNLRSQFPSHGYALDFHGIDKAAATVAEQLKGHTLNDALATARRKDGFIEGMESIQRFWKYSVLLRPAWFPRVFLGDEFLRRVVVTGSLLKVGAETLARVPDVMARSTAYFRDRTGNRRLFGTSLMGSLTAGGAVALGPAGAAMGFAAGGAALMAERFLGHVRDLDSRGFRFGNTMIEEGTSSHSAQGRLFADNLSSSRSVLQFASDRGGIRMVPAREGGVPAAIHPSRSGPMAGVNVKQVEAADHLQQWTDVLNRQFANDALLQTWLKAHLDGHPTPVAFARRWMLETTQGRRFLDEIGRSGRQGARLEEWAMRHLEMRMNFVEDYVGISDATRPVLEAMQGASVTTDMLEAIYPEVDARPVIHGKLAEQEFGRGPVARAANGFVQSAMTLITTLPTDVLSREPMFAYNYSRDVMHHLTTRGYGPDDLIPKAEIAEIQQSAREWALQQTRGMLYDLHDTRRIDHAVRLIVPFFPAIREMASRWLGLAVEHPDRVARLYAAWDALGDARGSFTIPGTGIEVGREEVRYGEDPEDIDQVLVLHLPAEQARAVNKWIGGAAAGALNSQGDVRIPLNAFGMNPVSGGMDSLLNFGVGPLAGIPMAEAARRMPQLSDYMERIGIFPMGVPDSTIEALAPGWLKQMLPTQLDPDRWSRTLAGITQTHMVRMQLGEEPQVDWRDPGALAAFFKTVEDEAAGFHFLTGLVNSASIAPLQFTSPFATQILELRELYDAHPGNPAQAEAIFIDTVGEEYFALLERFTRNNKGIPTTLGGYEHYQQWQPLIDSNPRIARFILAQDDTLDIPEMQYSSAVRDWMMTQSDPATGEPFFELKTPQEFATDAMESAGWIAYQRVQQVIDAEMDRRGLANLQQQDAAGIAAYRRSRIDEIAEQYPQWYAAYTDSDPEQRAETREQFRNVVEAAATTHPELAGRVDVAAVADYLALRDAVVVELRRRDAAGGSGILTATSNLELARMVEEMVEQMRQADRAFGDVYSRWFERDLRDARSDNDIGSEGTALGLEEAS